jgi:hypothetical protein
VKTIVAAWIEQILKFDSKLEYLAYIEGLRTKKTKFKEIEQNQDECGVVTLRIRKQYNKNAFPDN